MYHEPNQHDEAEQAVYRLSDCGSCVAVGDGDRCVHLGPAPMFASEQTRRPAKTISRRTVARNQMMLRAMIWRRFGETSM